MQKIEEENSINEIMRMAEGKIIHHASMILIVILTCHDRYVNVHRNNLDYRDVNCGYFSYVFL